MTDIRSIQPGKYNQLLADAMKELGEFNPPEWVSFVKSSAHNMRPINEEGFWYKRAASILRQVYIQGIVGVQRLRTRYGGSKKRGSRPKEFRKAGGKIIRSILQQAEKAGFLEKSDDKRKGRKLTEKGRKFLEDLAK